MKALMCARCGDIQALRTQWRSCECGAVSARWVSPTFGTAEFKGDFPAAFLLGMSNTVLTPIYRGDALTIPRFAMLAEEATDAPGYMFDKSKANAWAVIVKPGRTVDVTWLGDEE